MVKFHVPLETPMTGKVNRQLKCLVRAEIHDEITKETEKIKNTAAKVDKANTQFKIKRITTLKRALKKDEEVKCRLAKLKNAEHERKLEKLYEKCLNYETYRVEKRVKENNKLLKREYEVAINIERIEKEFQTQWKSLDMLKQKCREKRRKEILGRLSVNQKEQKQRELFKKNVNKLEQLVEYYTQNKVDFEPCLENYKITNENLLKWILNISLRNLIKYQLCPILKLFEEVAFVCVKKAIHEETTKKYINKKLVEKLVQKHKHKYVWLKSPPQYFLDRLKHYCDYRGNFRYKCIDQSKDGSNFSFYKGAYEPKSSKSNYEEKSFADSSLNVKSSSNPVSPSSVTLSEINSPEQFLSQTFICLVPKLFGVYNFSHNNNKKTQEKQNDSSHDSQRQDTIEHEFRNQTGDSRKGRPNIGNIKFLDLDLKSHCLSDPADSNMSLDSSLFSQIEKLVTPQDSDELMKHSCFFQNTIKNHCLVEEKSGTSFNCEKFICKKLCPDEIEHHIDTDCSKYIPCIKFQTNRKPMLSSEIYKELNITDDDDECKEDEKPISLEEEKEVQKETQVKRKKKTPKKIRQKIDHKKERELLEITSEYEPSETVEEDNDCDPFCILYNSIHFLKTEILNIICKLLTTTSPPKNLKSEFLSTGIENLCYFEQELNYLIHDFVIDDKELCDFIEKFCLFTWYTSYTEDMRMRKRQRCLTIPKKELSVVSN